jgi:hypothetical protein
MGDSTADTRAHIDLVQMHIKQISFMLQHRASAHDASKLEEPEKSGFDQLVTRLADVEYGTDAYRAALAEAAPAIAHHYAHNSHHPEHWIWPLPESVEEEEIAVLRHDIEVLESLEPQTEGGLELRVIARLKRDLAVLESRVNGMSLLDVTEMLADHKGASERTKQGSIEQSMDANRKRFGYSDQLYNILRNTIRELGW